MGIDHISTPVLTEEHAEIAASERSETVHLDAGEETGQPRLTRSASPHVGDNARAGHQQHLRQLRDPNVCTGLPITAIEGDKGTTVEHEPPHAAWPSHAA